jgi:hypothetical protein
MKSLRTLLLAGAAVALASGSVLAAETISLNADLNGSSIGSIGPVSGGGANIGGTSGGIAFTVQAFGVPIVPSPDFGTITFDVNGNATGTNTLTILAGQQGLTNFPSGSFASVFAGDFGIGGANIQSIVMSTWVDPANGLFAQTNLLGSQVCLGALLNCAPQTDFATVAGLGTFSETEKFVVTFTGPAAFQGNIQILASAVPEPATWGMMLLGFVGLGVAFRNRRRMVGMAA